MPRFQSACRAIFLSLIVVPCPWESTIWSFSMTSITDRYTVLMKKLKRNIYKGINWESHISSELYLISADRRREEHEHEIPAIIRFRKHCKAEDVSNMIKLLPYSANPSESCSLELSSPMAAIRDFRYLILTTLSAVCSWSSGRHTWKTPR